MTFALHPRLAADTFLVGDLPLCRVLLMNDQRFPWLILVPRRADIREIIDLTAPERAILMEEIASAATALKAAAACHKLNVGALGNMVPQLHIHVVARSEGDAAWPGPVWGSGTAEAYAVPAAEQLLADLRHRVPGLRNA